MQIAGLKFKRLLVVGASARAAAASVKRAGLNPLAADMYCDSDLRAVCKCERLSPYPHGAKQYFETAEADAWMYVGGIENHPDLVGSLAAQLPLLGNSCDVLRNVRNPWKVAAILHERGISVPKIMPPGRRPATGDWICKPLRSCGGKDVLDWNLSATKSGATEKAADGTTSGRIFQELIKGMTIGAVFVADANTSQFVGATQQLAGTHWLGARGYVYAGSIGPLNLNDDARQQLERIGAALTDALRLRGIFGVDAMWDGASIWPIEVNPRYTASVEVLERALDVDVVRAHVQGCQAKLPPLKAGRPRCFSGKAILYAREESRISSQLLEFIETVNSAGGESSVADVPDLGQPVAKGHPVVSLLADAADQTEVLKRLQRLACSVNTLLAART